MKKVQIILLVLFLSSSLLWANQELTLDQCLEIGVQNNPTLKEANNKVEKTKAQIQSAWAVVLPQLKAEASYSKMDSYQYRLSTMGRISETDYYSTKLSATQLLFGTHALPVLQSADLAYKAVLDEYNGKKQQVTFQIIQAYLGVQKTKRLYKLSYNFINNIKAHLNLVEQSNKVGLVNKIAVLQVKVRLKETESMYLQTEKAYELAKLNLKYLIGKDLKEDLALADEINYKGFLLDEKQNHFAENLNLAYQRPDLEALNKTKDLLKTNVAIVGSSGWPGVYLTGYYGFIDTTKFAVDNANRDWMAAVAVSWTFFDGFSTSSKVQQAEKDVANLELQIKSLKDLIQIQVQEAMLAIDIANKEIENNSEAVNLANENFRLAQEQFRAGIGTNQAVLDAEFSLQQASTNLVNAEFTLLESKSKLKYILGII